VSFLAPVGLEGKLVDYNQLAIEREIMSFNPFEMLLRAVDVVESTGRISPGE